MPGAPSHVRALPTLAAVVVACLALGYTASARPLVGGIVIGAFLAFVTYTYCGQRRFTIAVLAAIPWLVVLNTLIPKLTLTFTSAAAAGLLLLLAPPRFKPESLVWIGTTLFGIALVVGVVESTTGDQLILAAKYLVLPAMALVVSTRAGREALLTMRKPLLASGVVAMAAQLVIITLGLGSTSSKYGAGELLGFATQNPHELALVGVTVAMGCLLTVKDIRWRLLTAGIAVAPSLATGVRSAVVALTISLLIFAVRSRLRLSVLVGIGVLVAVVLASPAGTIISTRYQQDTAEGEYASSTAIGSDRGALWTIAFEHWAGSGFEGTVVGEGFRSVGPIESEALSVPDATAQSDPLTLLVENGVLGLVGWLLIWLALFRSRIEWLLLIPLLSYGLTNGALEYVGATVYGIALAGACAPVRRLRRARPGARSRPASPEPRPSREDPVHA